jgi:hypothetical protein
MSIGFVNATINIVPSILRLGLVSLWKFQTIVDMFLFWHFKIMVIIPSCAKRLIWVLRNLNLNLKLNFKLVLIKDIWTWTTVA